MKIFIAALDIFSATGGGQSFYADLIRAYPDHDFYSLSHTPVEQSRLPHNFRSLPLVEVYRAQAADMRFNSSDFSIGGMTLAGKEGDLLYFLDIAESVVG